ncbi:MAG TPA: porin, partial [Pseudolabrys sp.]
ESTQGAGGNTFNANRAFIQFAGFTFGITQSFFDLFPQPSLSYFGGMIAPSNDTGDGGQTVTAYTASFGGGLSATLSLEAPRTTDVVGPLGSAGSAAFSTTAGPGQSAVGETYPDVVANLRLDQTWGTAQVMGAIHNVSGQYYGANTSTGQPSNNMGWAIAGGVKILFPSIGPGDYLAAQVSYTEGAIGYLDDGAASSTPTTPGASGYYSVYNGGGGYGFGVVSDGVFGAGGSVELTTAWSVNAAYEHFWNKHWQTSVYGTYLQTTYDTTANANLCAVEAPVLGMAVATGCNNNWSYYDIGTRTQWNVDSQTYIGLDVIYTNLTSAKGATPTAFGSGTQPVAVRTLGDQSAWIAEMRVHRNFYP